MKTSLLLASIMWAVASLTTVSAGEAIERLRKAESSYNAGDYAGAIQLYEGVLSEGYSSSSVLFNLGNAWFRQGDIGRAVLSYRRAWHVSPRDAEVNANLRFALQQAGVPSNEPGVAETVAIQLNRTEWTRIAIVAYWTAAGLLALSWFVSRGKLPLRRAAVVTAGVAVVALAGTLYWHRYQSHPEAVITEPSVQALFAPLERAKAHFPLPVGSIARVLEHSGDWVRVEAAGRSGWVPRRSCELVLPRGSES